MTYTEQQKQALSRKVAEKYGIPAKIMVAHVNGNPALCEMFTAGDEIEIKPLWLHEYNHAVIMELCVKHGVNAEIKTFKDSGYMHTLAKAVTPSGRWFVRDVKDHGNDVSEAERIARLMALGEVTG